MGHDDVKTVTIITKMPQDQWEEVCTALDTWGTAAAFRLRESILRQIANESPAAVNKALFKSGEMKL